MAILSSVPTSSSTSHFFTTHLKTLTTTPPFLPPSDEELTSLTHRESVNPDALLSFQLELIGALKGILEHLQERREQKGNGEAAAEAEGKEEEEDGRIACAVARWDVRSVGEEGEYDEEEKLDGWIVPREARLLVKDILSSLFLTYPNLSTTLLTSLRPVFSSHAAPPTISTTSFRPLPTRLQDDSASLSVAWRTPAGWGCWNVLRLGIEACDPKQPPPLPLFLPPLLTLLDEPTPAYRIRGLVAFASLLSNCSQARLDLACSRGWGGKWLEQTGLGELFMKSLDLSLSNPTSPTLTLLLMPLSLSLSTHLLTLLHPLTPSLPPSSAATAAASSVTSTSPIKGRGTPARTAYIDNIIQRAFVGTWAYRTGGEEGDAARELASWLASPDDKRGRWFLDVLGGWQVVRHLGTLLPSLLLPLTTLSPGSPRSFLFLSDLLTSITHVLTLSLAVSLSRVAAWRGKVLGGVGRLWVAVRETQLVDGTGDDALERLKESIHSILALLSRSSPAFASEVQDLIFLDVKIFSGLNAGLPDVGETKPTEDTSSDEPLGTIDTPVVFQVAG